jgi:hypothetical protein
VLWHTNLVPNYYELDDFQVRTPTDVIGQHIHLVKFDVTASDGAANGYNYEDGTFGPREVRDRIHAISNVGGIFGLGSRSSSPSGRTSTPTRSAGTPATTRTASSASPRPTRIGRGP